MDKMLLIAVISAIVCPFIWSLVNIFDKFLVSNKVKNPMSYCILAGMVNLVIGVILALFLDWSSLTTFNQLFIPAIAGVIFGSQFFTYLYLFSKEDASHVIGIVYVYPVFVGILSYLFLSEKFSLITYIGASIVIIGAVFLSINLKLLKKRFISWMLILLVLSVAVYEFLFKVSTNNLPEWNGIALTQIFCGLTIMLGFFHTKTRKGVLRELKYFKWRF